MALYDSIAEIYDPWSASVVEDIAFYVDEAERCEGPVVELAVGSGRIAVPIARAGRRVIGVDLSQGMLDVARGLADEYGVGDLVDLRIGDLREPPVEERVPLVICPFRSLLHLRDEQEKLRALRAARALLEPGGRLVFDVFAPSSEDISETHGVWLEREPNIFERADWDESARTLRLSVRSGDAAAAMDLHWLSAIEWRRLIDEAGFDVEALYGWFDRRPFKGGEDMIWVCKSSNQNEDSATGRDGRVRCEDAGRPNSSAIRATEDEAACRPARPGGTPLHFDFEVKAPRDARRRSIL